MKIDRSQLLGQLNDFVRSGNGIIVGNPGVGKTYMLRELKNKLLNENVVSILVNVDSLIDASDDEIQREIDITDNWLETLPNVTIGERKNVLIFDAFDAARDESLRNSVLKQIARAQQFLFEKWNIVVSVRSYDATKSPKLQKLFPQNLGVNGNSCRLFQIPELNQNELNAVLEEEKDIGSVYQGATAELRRILRIPYFIILLKRILNPGLSDSDLLKIKAVRTESQLLDSYWRSKVTDDSNTELINRILYSITSDLLKQRKLVTSIRNFYEKSTIDVKLGYEYLRSEDILNEFGVNRNLVGYSHNILFDYAVSKLFLSEISSDFLNFILQDKTRPFFLRPSLNYFFADLWYENRAGFWELYWYLHRSQDREVQLVISLIPNATIASEYNGVSDLLPVLDNKISNSRKTTMREILRSLILLRKNNPEVRDIHLLAELSKDLQVEYIWEYSQLMLRLIDNENFGIEDYEVIGRISRSFLTYILDHSEDDAIQNKEAWNTIGSNRGILAVSKTYNSDILESRKLLSRVLLLIERQNFDISYIRNLVSYMTKIQEFDPKFAADIYVTVFAYEEYSDEKTSMGGSVELSLTSTRRQDYRLCKYELLDNFPIFIRSSVEIAIQTGLQLANFYREYPSTLTEPEFEFIFRNVKCVFVPDNSHLHVYYDSTYNPKKLVEVIIEHLESLITTGEEDEFIRLLDIYIRHAKAGFTWSKIILLASRYPKALKDVFISLVTIPILLESGETIEASCEFIGSVTEFASDEEIRVLEKAALKILDQSVFPNIIDEEYRIARVSRILNMIPRNRLQTAESEQFVVSNRVVANEPAIRFYTKAVPYSEDLWLKDQGVDIDKPIHSEALEMQRLLKSFISNFANDAPGSEIFNYPLTIAAKLFGFVREHFAEMEDDVITSVLTDVAKAYVIACRSVDSLSKEQVDFAKETLLFCFSYHSKFDDIADSPSAGYSPTPRTEASEGLPFLVVHDETDDILKVYLSATTDKQSVVRFNSLKRIREIKEKYPDDFWHVIFDRIRNEEFNFSASICLDAVYNPTTDLEKASWALNLANSRKDLIYEGSTFAKRFVDILLRLAFKNDEAAFGLIRENIPQEGFSKELIYAVFNFLDPGHPHNNYWVNRERNRSFFTIFNEILDYYGKKLQVISKPSDTGKDDVNEVLKIFDIAVEQVYQALDLRSIRRRDRLQVSEDNREAFYFLIKPSLIKILDVAQNTTSSGLLIPHTAHYFSKILNGMVTIDARDVLAMALRITKYSFHLGYTFDSKAIEQMIGLTETIFADHRLLIQEDESFSNLVALLDYYVQSGWPQATELLWRLDEIFR